MISVEEHRTDGVILNVYLGGQKVSTVSIQMQDDGLSVDVFPHDDEADSVTSTWATWGELTPDDPGEPLTDEQVETPPV